MNAAALPHKPASWSVQLGDGAPSAVPPPPVVFVAACALPRVACGSGRSPPPAAWAPRFESLAGVWDAFDGPPPVAAGKRW